MASNRCEPVDSVGTDHLHGLVYNTCVCADGAGGMLLVHVASDSNQPGVPVVEGSGKGSEALTLQVF